MQPIKRNWEVTEKKVLWQRARYTPVRPLGEDNRLLTGCKEHIELTRNLRYRHTFLHRILDGKHSGILSAQKSQYMKR